MKYFTLLFCALLFGNCATKNEPIDFEAEKSSLQLIAEAYHNAAKMTDVEAITAIYSNEAKIIPPNGEVVEGIENIKQFVTGFTGLNNFEVSFGELEINLSAHGGMGYSIAEGVLSYTDADGNNVSDKVRDFHVWKKENNEWKLVIDIWNSSAQPTIN